MTRALGWVVAAVAATGAATAQGRAATRPAGAAESRVAARDNAFKMVDAYLLSNLQESLELSDQQYLRLLPLVKAQQGARRELVQRRVRTLFALRRALRSGQATESSVAALLGEVKKVESEGPVTLLRHQQAIDAQLAPMQQAKYRVLEGEVERKVRELLRKAARARARERQERGGGGEPEIEEP